MSKICSKCGTTNYESASRCAHCNTPFVDGAYKIGGGVSVKDQRKVIDKSSKLLIFIIGFILLLIITLVVVFALTNSNSKSVSTPVDTDVVQQQDVTRPDMTNLSNIITSGKPGDGEAFNPDFVPVDHIELSTEAFGASVGDVCTISAWIYPENASNQEIYWYSDDESVAIVDDNGTVTMVGEGVVNILACSSSEEPYNYCTIEVSGMSYVPDDLYDYGMWVAIASDYLALRNGPDTSYDKIMEVEYGTYVEVMAYEQDSYGNVWAYISCDGVNGWVFDKYLMDASEFEED